MHTMGLATALFLLTHGLYAVACTTQTEPGMFSNRQPQDSARVRVQTRALGETMPLERTDSRSGAERLENDLLTKAKTQGSVRVIVRLKLDNWKPEGDLSSQQAVTAQREAITNLQTRLLQRMASFSITNVKQFKFVPQVAMDVDAAGVKDLLSNPEVIGISEDVAAPPTF